MTREMLRILSLRRQAASYGWRLARISGPRDARVLNYERVDEDGTHRAWVALGYDPKPHEKWDTHYRSTAFESHASDGFLRFEHVGERQAVGMIRAYFGWSA